MADKSKRAKGAWSHGGRLRGMARQRARIEFYTRPGRGLAADATKDWLRMCRPQRKGVTVR